MTYKNAEIIQSLRYALIIIVLSTLFSILIIPLALIPYQEIHTVISGLGLLPFIGMDVPFT